MSVSIILYFSCTYIVIIREIKVVLIDCNNHEQYIYTII